MVSKNPVQMLQNFKNKNNYFVNKMKNLDKYKKKRMNYKNKKMNV